MNKNRMKSKAPVMKKIGDVERGLRNELEGDIWFQNGYKFPNKITRYPLRAKPLKGKKYPEVDMFFYSNDRTNLALIEFEAVCGQPLTNLVKIILYLDNVEKGREFKELEGSPYGSPGFSRIYFFHFLNTRALKGYYRKGWDFCRYEIIPLIEKRLEKLAISFLYLHKVIDYHGEEFIRVNKSDIVNQMRVFILNELKSRVKKT